MKKLILLTFLFPCLAAAEEFSKELACLKSISGILNPAYNLEVPSLSARVLMVGDLAGMLPGPMGHDAGNTHSSILGKFMTMSGDEIRAYKLTPECSAVEEVKLFVEANRKIKARVADDNAVEAAPGAPR